MAELGHLHSDRLALVDQLANDMYNVLVAEVIGEIMELPDNCRQSGDDSKLGDVWEEFKWQLQNDESIYFEAYVDTIQAICLRHVATLDTDRQRLLWLWSEGYLRQWASEDTVTLTDIDLSDIDNELYRRVCYVAINEPLRYELEEEIAGLWPDDWPGKEYVELDSCGDAGDWLNTALGEKPLTILQDLPNYEEHLARCLAEAYLRELERMSIDMPWALGDDPTDPAWITECKAGIQKEFVAFLREWRDRAAESLAKLSKMTSVKRSGK